MDARRSIVLGLVLTAACGTSGAVHPARAGGPPGATSGATTASGAPTGAGASTTSGATGGHGTTGGAGSVSTTGESSPSTTGAPFPIAAHAPFPQILDHGGQLLTAPALVTVGFPANQTGDLSAALGPFGDALVRSDWLAAVGAEYGVGFGTHVQDLLADITLSPGSTIDDVAVRAFLADHALDGGLPLPTPETVYLFVFPTGVTVTNASLGQSCQNFGGYHGRFSEGGQTFVYAVVPTCAASRYAATAPPPSVVAAHELIEAATDPAPDTGYALSSGTWSVLGNEIGDLCEGSRIDAGGYALQRIWSNRLAALQTGSPCAPVPSGDVYFNVTADSGQDAGPYVGLLAPASASQDLGVTLTAWATAAVGFELTLAQLEGPAVVATIKAPNGRAPLLHNGDTLQMTVTVPAGVPSGTDIGIALVTSADGFETQHIAPLLLRIR